MFCLVETISYYQFQIVFMLLEMATAMMRLTILNAIMMVGTVVWVLGLIHSIALNVNAFMEKERVCYSNHIICCLISALASMVQIRKKIFWCKLWTNFQTLDGATGQ